MNALYNIYFINKINILIIILFFKNKYIYKSSDVKFNLNKNLIFKKFFSVLIARLLDEKNAILLEVNDNMQAY